MSRKIYQGSINQTSQMHQISQDRDYDCRFSQVFTDDLAETLINRTKVVDVRC